MYETLNFSKPYLSTTLTQTFLVWNISYSITIQEVVHFYTKLYSLDNNKLLKFAKNFMQVKYIYSCYEK
jgi:hypothetical protein